MDIQQLIEMLESRISNASDGLPKEVFHFVSRLTPMINVDLLVKNRKNETLLTWREDEFYGPGWHIPGGIVRFKETIASRIAAVAGSELGATVTFKKEPIAMNEVTAVGRNTRGHFISLLYECALTSSPDSRLEYKAGTAKHGEWAWHARCPDNLISVHDMYKHFISFDSRHTVHAVR